MRAAAMLAVHGAAAVCSRRRPAATIATAPRSIRFPSPSRARPWAAAWAVEGALVATAAAPDAPDQSFAMLVGTGTPLTLLAGTPSTPPATEKVGFDLLDPLTSAPIRPGRAGALSRRQHPPAAAAAAR